jgi:tetratricopeptide (TPR) repeat protein
MTQVSRHSDAIACYSTVLALAPEFSQARVWRAAAYNAIGEGARAKVDLDVVLGRTPDHTPALLLRGIANLHLREFADAELDLTRVLEREPNNTRVHFIRARVRMARGDTAGAAADRKDGLQKDPGDELSWITRGVARQVTDPKAALADFDEALRINPNSREAAQNKAATLSEFLGRTPEAVKVLDSLLDRFPKFVEARIGRGVLLARLGNRIAAHADVAQALQLDQSAPTLYRAGCVYALTTKIHATDADAAFRYLSAAMLANCTEDVSRDDDLSALRANPMEFARLLNLAAKTASAK